MLNLMRFYSSLRHFPGVPAFLGTPQQANDLYEDKVTPLLLAQGGYPTFAGTVQGQNVMGFDPSVDHWSRVLLVRYPSRRSFLDLVTEPAYGPIEPYKLMALEVVLVPLSGEVILPDIRLVTVATALVIFLAAGWIRAARGRT